MPLLSSSSVCRVWCHVSPAALGVHRAKCCSSVPSWLQCPTALPALATAFVFAATSLHFPSQLRPGLTLCRVAESAVIQRGQWSVPSEEPKQRAEENLCCLSCSSNWMSKATGANDILIFPLLWVGLFLPLLFFPDCFTVYC